LSPKEFFAKNWFAFESDKTNEEVQALSPTELLKKEIQENRMRATRVCLPDFAPKKNILKQDDSTEGFNPAKHLLQGWEGTNLSSKASLTLSKTLEILAADIREKLLGESLFNKKTKNKLYDEFISFAHSKGLNCTELDQSVKFWAHLPNEDSPYREAIDQFINLYSFRTATIYFLKLRFAKSVSIALSIELNNRDILNPNTFIYRQFKKGSSKELYSKSFAPNIFSWYRPSENLFGQINELSKITQELSIAEIIKYTSQKNHVDENNQIYSHALSHKNFGLFLNCLVINFPLWFESSIGNSQLGTYGMKDEMEIISSKYSGDYLESISVSHWLAQDNNKDVRWDHFICPKFFGDDFEYGLFIQLFNELQLLHFTVNFAKVHQHDVIGFTSKTTERNLLNKKRNLGAQRSFLYQDAQSINSSYDRVVLNLTNFPKNNPNHFLFHQIKECESEVKEGGYLYVLSNKKLFVDSLKEKVDIILKSYQIEGSLDLEDVKGKGEVPNYIYILKRKDLYSSQKSAAKQNCLSFRFKLDLKSFNDFSTITDQLQTFFRTFLKDRPALYQGEYMEFYQDAIKDGRLIRSSKKDSSSITHPSFFKNLLSSSLSLDTFFEVGTLETHQQNYEDLDFGMLGLDLGRRDEYPYVCIIDRRQSDDIKLEIINYSAYSAKYHQYGTTKCHYFGLRPKFNGININLFREYFNSPIGRQISHITFESFNKKFKSKLQTLLVPKFFSEDARIPDHIYSGINYLLLDYEELKNIPSLKIQELYTRTEMIISNLVKNYPTRMFGHLCFFKNNIRKMIEDSQRQRIDFTNSFIMDAVTKLNVAKIYPNHPEVYIDFLITNKQDIFKPLASVKFEEQENEKATLSLFDSEDEEIVKIHTSKVQGKFLDFILAKANGHPIIQIITGLSLPTQSDLNAVFDGHKSQIQGHIDLYSKVNKLSQSMLTSLIGHKPN
jgi:hypothetical protein